MNNSTDFVAVLLTSQSCRQAPIHRRNAQNYLTAFLRLWSRRDRDEMESWKAKLNPEILHAVHHMSFDSATATATCGVPVDTDALVRRRHGW